MNLIESIAVLFTLITIILTVKENKYCWAFSIIGVTFYAIFFYQEQIWGNLLLQSVFLIQSVLGWYNWDKPSRYKIRWMSNKRWLLFIIPPILFYLIYTLTTYLGGTNVVIDSITTTLSLMGTMLLVYKKIESWVFWILADIMFIVLFFMGGFYLSAVIYFVFLFLAIKGLKEWSKSLKKI